MVMRMATGLAVLFIETLQKGSFQAVPTSKSSLIHLAASI